MARRAPRSPLKTAAVTITALLVLYYLFRSTDPSTTSLEDSVREAMGAKRRPPSSVVHETGHGDARDLGFKQPPQQAQAAAVDKQPIKEAVEPKRPPPRQPEPAAKPVPPRGPQRLNDKDRGVNKPQRIARPAVRPAPPQRPAAAPPVPDPDDAAEPTEDDLEVAVVGVGKPHLDDDEVELPQKKKVEEKVAKKNAPLGGQAGERKDTWGNAGWQQRFKPKAQAAEHAEEAHEQDMPLAGAAAKLLAHPLVARYAAMEYSDAPSTSDEESFQADGAASDVGGPARKYNLTICALVPGETRFLSEWLLYHRLLGVDHFSLYDTSAGGAHGAAEVDGLADKMEREGKGDLGPTADEIKAGISGTGAEGVAADGFVYSDRLAGLESWLKSDAVSMHYMRFKDSKGVKTLHQNFVDHCAKTYSTLSNWIIHLDVDEFLSVSEPLYGPKSPYRVEDEETAKGSQWRYPLHDLLERPATSDAACIPVPHMRFRNLGVRELHRGQGVLDTQTRRDAFKQSTSPEKTFIHTAYSSGHVKFDGPHSCKVASRADLPKGMSEAIKNSQGQKIQDGGVYESTRLPTEPLSIAHYVQRDLADCHAKLGLVQDANSAYSKGRGTVMCEEFYLPTQDELSSESFRSDSQNRFLARTPPDGTVVEDTHMRDSWAARATKVILQSGRKHGVPHAKEIEAARRKVQILSF